MEKNKKNTILLAAAVFGFIYWVLLLVLFFYGIFNGIQVDFFEGFSSLINNGEFKWILLIILGVIIIIAPSILNLIGWKKKNNVLIIITIILYLITLNILSVMICVFGILWNSKNELDVKEKNKTPLFIISGIFGILGIIFWFVPLITRVDSGVSDSLFSVLMSGAINEKEIFLKVIIFGYIIALLLSFIVSISICLVTKLRNNIQKTLIATIFYIISLSIPSAILCFIGFLCLKKQSIGSGSIEK